MIGKNSHFISRVGLLRSPAVLSCFLAMMASGCGGPVDGQLAVRRVSGKVTFNGQPVTEGTVVFEDAAAGLGGSGDLTADGSYSTELSDGNYKVVVTPPVIQLPDSETSPGGTEFKQVADIPEKYRAGDSTPLTADVSSESLIHDFVLMP